jgi:hypothetical protein
MNKLRFLTQLNNYRDLTAGRGRQIADKAGIAYNKYLAYRRGNGNNVEVMEEIIKAIEELKEEMLDALNSINLES